MAKHAFEKFMNKELSGAKKKEAFKQEKKKIKKELRAKGEEERKRNEDKYRLVTSKDKKEIKVDSSTTEEKHGRAKQFRQFKTKGFQHSKTTPRYKQGQPVKQTYDQITQKP